MPDLVRAYWSGALRRLQAEVDGIARLVQHAGEQGRENEQALSRMLTSLIPRRIATGSGLIIDSESSQSPQVDVIVYDEMMESALFAQTTQLLYPIEAVFAGIEVKTTLRADDVAEFGDNAQHVRALRSRRNHQDDSAGPLLALFAYAGWAHPKTMVDHIARLADDALPDLFCVVDQGLVGRLSLVRCLGPTSCVS